ncbi:MAG: helix-turn-helix domain-containing protein [Gammaproteobacteria bacterium]
MASSQHWTPTVTPEDKVFYQTLGQRIATRRKALNITQQQLADTLGIAQQTLAHYEVGRLRIPVALLSTLARTLTVSVEDLLGEASRRANAKRGPTPKLQRQLEQIGQLPRAKQRFVMDMLDTVLQQRG